MNRIHYLLFALLTAVIVSVPFIVQGALEGEGLTISPPIVELELKPGESKANIIRISNPTEALVEAYPKTMDFRAKGESGEPAFMEGEEAGGNYALSSWITFSEPKIAMASEQVKEFSYTITVPTNAEPGGHYGAVFFATDPPESEGGEFAGIPGHHDWLIGLGESTGADNREGEC